MEKLKILFLLFLIAFQVALATEEVEETKNTYPECHKSNLQWFPHQTNCSLYFICHHGNAIQRSCAPELHFNNQTGQCMIPALANCSLSCPAKDDPKNVLFLPDFNDCQKYYICYNGEAVHRSCAEGLLFDTENDWCDFESVVECGHRGDGGGDRATVPLPEITPPPPPEEISTTTSTVTTTTSGLGITYVICPVETGTFYFPHAIRCDKYFKCYNSISYLKECPDGLEFDQFEEVCKTNAKCYSRNPTTAAP